MRIVTITRLASTLLACLALSLAIILYWGLGQLNQSFINTLDYSELHRQLAVEVRGKIRNYLETGDATQQLEAVRDLEHLQQEVMPGLPVELVKQLQPSATALYSGLTNEFLGAGKLAGDAQGLLYQNERETAAELRRLETYGLQALEHQPATGVGYTQGLARLAQLLSDIKTHREQFWSSGNDLYLHHLEQARLSYAQELKQLDGLPRIGLYAEQQQDAMADLLGWGNRASLADREEQGDEILRNLKALHERYPAEMERSQRWRQDRTDSFIAVNQLIDNFEQAIIQGQAEVHANKESIESLVKRLFFAFALGLLLMAVLLYVFQQRVVLNNLAKLESALTALVKKGNLDPVDMEADATELGRIAKRFNQLIAGMREQQEQKNQQLLDVGVTLEQVLGSFDNISANALQTREQLQKSGQFSQTLRDLAEQVNQSSDQVRNFAEETADLMRSSEQRASEVVQAGEQAIQKIDSGQQALADLVQAVQEVMGILEQVSGISEQTNLLALNAAIEAARAGEHGRGFAVVADEVRQLSQKTQGAVGQSTNLLGALNTVTDRLRQHIEEVAQFTDFQCNLARKLQETALQVSERSSQASKTAQEGSSLSERQHQSVGEFNQQMQEMERGAREATSEIEQLRSDVSNRIDWLRASLGLQT
jgi:methyl-accepting chemotaxis protein